MKKTFTTLTLSIGAFFVNSQTVTPTVLSNNGGYAAAAQGSIAWTIGEPVSETYTTSTKKTTMGFHQPELGVANLIKEQSDNAQVLVFPNPVKDVLNISFKDLESATYSIEVIDNLGKLLYKSNVNITENTKTIHLNMTEYAAGNYFLHISSAQLNKTIKINKTY